MESRHFGAPSDLCHRSAQVHVAVPVSKRECPVGWRRSRPDIRGIVFGRGVMDDANVHIGRSGELKLKGWAFHVVLPGAWLLLAVGRKGVPPAFPQEQWRPVILRIIPGRRLLRE